jgi:hypothetical protein|tara:strand:+ start:113 stop:433 length:321 start_codon:yes stop_codon:yes gene_type:complete
MALEGEHIALEWKCVNNTPSRDSKFKLGVSISPPYISRSENAKSSASRSITFGLSSIEFVRPPAGAEGKFSPHDWIVRSRTMNIENRGCKRIALLITGIYQKQKKG